MDLIFAYVAGLLTLINPCVLPVLPIALAASASASRAGPLALAAGMSLAFTTLGVAISAAGPALGIDAEVVAQAGAVLMILFGFSLLVPRLGLAFAGAAAGLANAADSRIGGLRSGSVGAQFAAGALLGAVWSPCIGPTLGGAIGLASQGESLGWAGAIMLAFSLGVSTVVLALAYGTREAVRARQASLRELAAWSKPALGVALVVVGLAILLQVHHWLEGVLIDAMPVWLQDLSVAF